MNRNLQGSRSHPNIGKFKIGPGGIKVKYSRWLRRRTRHAVRQLLHHPESYA